MNLAESLKMAIAAILGNKLRSLLTALGIIFGVGAVVAMISIGQGATKDISDRIASMGSNLITVSPMRGTVLTMDDAPELLERVSTITKALPAITFSVTAKGLTNTYDTSVEGTTQDYPEVRNSSVKTGRFFSEDEVNNRSQVAVIGQDIVDELFDGKTPLGGQKIIIKGQSFSIIGVLEEKGSSMGRSSDDIILIPVTVASRLNNTKQLSAIYLQAKSAEVANLAVAHVTAIFNQKLRRENAVRVSSQDQLLDTISTTTQTLTIMLGAIAGISLLVGGIGIMNIMLVSVTERTREIGIRKALGAKNRNIMWQFIVESVILSVAGGLIGIALGIGAAKAVTFLAKWTTLISLPAILISFFFAMGVGLFFGVYPAYKAANLDPIVALRHE